MSAPLPAAIKAPGNSRWLLNRIAPLHHRLRTQKCQLFFSKLQPSRNDSMLDVGGGLGISGEFKNLYTFFREVRVVNLDPQKMEEEQFRDVRCDVGDGCALPYEDKSFDWVFSNAVIEHVGGEERQRRFAAEIQRVARKGYFVATPNRHFPVDPHTLLPLYQFLPVPVQRVVCRFSPGYLKQYEPIDLLSAKGLSELFAEGTVVKCGLPILSNNLVVFRRI